MTQDAPKPSLNITRIAVSMTCVAGVMMGLVCLVLPLVIKDARLAHALVAGGLTYGALMFGLLLTYIAKDAGALMLLKAQMLGMGLRMMLTLGIGYALVAVSGMELYSVVITMSAIYLPVMAVETALTAAEFQRIFAPGSPAGASEALS